MHEEQNIAKKHVIINPAFPFLRWTGSKKWLVKTGLGPYLPQSYTNYHEPFLGSGSVYFHLNPPGSAFLSDLNGELINFLGPPGLAVSATYFLLDATGTFGDWGSPNRAHIK